MRSITYLFLAACTLVLTLVLSACGGGNGNEEPAWPQSLSFTDFTGGQANLSLGGSNAAQTECQTCITLYGVARSSTELGNLLIDFWNTPIGWPSPYNNKPYSALPIDYNNKIAVVLEDKGSGARYQYTVQKVEESANTVTISVLKCMVSDPYQNGRTIWFGLLLPKTTKPIQVLTVQSGKPTLPEYQPNGLGAC